MAELGSCSDAYKRIRWQVIFSLFLWLCHSVSGQIHCSIVEEMRQDSVIANIAKDLGLDIKHLSSRKLRIESRISEKYFYVNLDNGNLYIKDRIDRETLCGTAASCFLTFDAVVENPLNVFRVKIEIQDINDNSPLFFHKSFTIEMIESTAPGTKFVLQNAEDPDIGINSVQTYKLSADQHFRLIENINPDGSKSPELVLEKALDRETQSIHELLLTAIDGGNPVRSGTAVLRIIVMDANDNFPVFTQQLYKVSLRENIAANTTIVSVNAVDMDEGVNGHFTYSFRKTSGLVHHSGIFIIHPLTGEIKTNRKLDYEEATSYELSVQAKDGGGLVSYSKVLIDVIDENDNPPEIIVTSFSSPFPEDSSPGTMIALVRVHDNDIGKNGEVDCKLTDDVSFHLILSSESYYSVISVGSIDREEISSYNITIVATDKGSPPLSSSRTILLEISDVNDNPPVFVKSTFFAYVPENNLPGASVYSIQASDPDIGDNSKILYSVSGAIEEDLAVSSYFSVNMETGVLYAQKSFDYEQQKEFLLQITATDNGSPSLSSNTTLIIKIVDQNDNAPKILYPSSESGGTSMFEIVPFATEPGSLVTKVVAVDADSGHNSWLSYHFLQSSEISYFFINDCTGEVRTSRAFQETDVMKHKVVVMVKDNGEPSLSATITLNFVITDNFQQVIPKFVDQFTEEDQQSNLQLYLLITLIIISFLFIKTVIVIVISKCKKPKQFPVFDPVSTHLYPQVDPRVLSQYSSGTLTLPYSYNVCVALDSEQGDFTYMKPNQNVPVDNLIDADDSGLGNDSLKEALPTSNVTQVSFFQTSFPSPSTLLEKTNCH